MRNSARGQHPVQPLGGDIPRKVDAFRAAERTQRSESGISDVAAGYRNTVRPKRSLFRKPEEAICLAVKFVPVVDAAAIAEVWGPAVRLKAPGASECAVILLGQLLAPPSELSAAIKEQLRKGRGGGPLLVPVDVRDWEAFFPPETPGAIRSLIQRLRDGKQ